MPSGHAAVSFSLWVATIYLSGSFPLTALTFLLAVMVSWSRWSSGVHRPREVFAGAFLGAGLTLLLFLLFSHE
jgi:diacylglycerol kinase (ATP)